MTPAKTTAIGFALATSLLLLTAAAPARADHAHRNGGAVVFAVPPLPLPRVVVIGPAFLPPLPPLVVVRPLAARRHGYGYGYSYGYGRGCDRHAFRGHDHHAWRHHERRGHRDWR